MSRFLSLPCCAFPCCCVFTPFVCCRNFPPYITHISLLFIFALFSCKGSLNSLLMFSNCILWSVSNASLKALQRLYTPSEHHELHSLSGTIERRETLWLMSITRRWRKRRLSYGRLTLYVPAAVMTDVFQSLDRNATSNSINI